MGSKRGTPAPPAGFTVPRSRVLGWIHYDVLPAERGNDPASSSTAPAAGVFPSGADIGGPVQPTVGPTIAGRLSPKELQFDQNDYSQPTAAYHDHGDEHRTDDTIGGDPMTDPGIAAQMEQLRQRLETIQRNQQKAQQRFARLDSMKEEVAAIEASVTSRDRAVTVVAGPGAAIKDVRFTDEAKRLTPNQLSHTVTATIQQAVADAARQQATVIQGYLGDQVDVLGRVLKIQEDVFGHEMRPEEQPAPQAQTYHDSRDQDEWATSAEPAVQPAQPHRPAHQPPPDHPDYENQVSVLRSEPVAAPRPSTPSTKNEDDEFLNLFEGEDG